MVVRQLDQLVEEVVLELGVVLARELGCSPLEELAPPWD